MCIKNSVILSPECLKYSSNCLKKVLNIVKKEVASKYYFFCKTYEIQFKYGLWVLKVISLYPHKHCL